MMKGGVEMSSKHSHYVIHRVDRTEICYGKWRILNWASNRPPEVDYLRKKGVPE